MAKNKRPKKQMVPRSHRLSQRAKACMSPLPAHRCLNRGSAVFPDVSSLTKGLNKQQQMASPQLSCTAKPDDDSKMHFAVLLLAVG